MSVSKESYQGRIQRKVMKKTHLVEVAMGRRKADLVLKNATYVNVFSNELCKGDIAVAKGQIVGMGSYEGDVEIDVSDKIVCPGFIDAHIHLESSLASPKEFARAVVPHGTTTVITDPHEITNVMGTDGIDYMLQATEGLPIDVRFMLPSCVPATPLDESGANLDYRAIDSFYDHGRVQGLAEMMNFVGVIGGDKEVLEKIIAAQAHHKKIDGHAPDLKDKDLAAYVAVGVYSDHECYDIEDAMRKLRNGQFIMVRDGTAARNLEALVDLLKQPYYDRCMFCTDDKHPIDLLEKGHIDYIIKKAIGYGVDPIVAVKVASHNTARYFALNNRGAIAPGYLADFAIIDNFENFNVEMVFKKGVMTCKGGEVQPFASPVIEEYLEGPEVSVLSFTDGKTIVPMVSNVPILFHIGPHEVVVNDVLGIAVIALQPPGHNAHPCVVHARGQYAEVVQRRVGDDEGEVGDDHGVVDEADGDVLATFG